MKLLIVYATQIENNIVCSELEHLIQILTYNIIFRNIINESVINHKRLLHNCTESCCLVFQLLNTSIASSKSLLIIFSYNSVVLTEA